jgi:cytochrome b6-f complex iron-sulfur subunit
MSKELNKDKHWKRDFPYQRSGATEVTRRDFAKFLCLVSGGMALGNGLVAARPLLFPEEEIPEQKVCIKSDIPVGGTRSFVLEGSSVPYILIHLENGEFKAYEQKCTHLSCAVYYKPGSGKIECPCHNGWFDAHTGEVLQGPPPRPLPKLEVIIKGEEIFVKSFDKNTKTDNV